LRVLFLSPEVAPFSKVGGLADVAASLPPALRRLGVDVTVATPRHGRIDQSELTPLREGTADMAGLQIAWRALTRDEVVFFDLPGLFDREEVYSDDPDEHLRWAGFCHAALDWARGEERFDVVHANDWQTGLVCHLAATPGHPASVFTIHNLGYQGRFSPDRLSQIGLDPGTVAGTHGLLGLAIATADMVTTVSPTYAREIQTPEGGAGLDGLLRARSGDLVGILNGIDPQVWNPRIDPLIPFHYSEKSLWRKEWDKQILLAEMGLAYRRLVPVVGVVSRLVPQKGFDIVEGPLRHFLTTWDLRVVVLGSGERRYVDMFRRLASEHPQRLAFREGYDERLSHLIEAGSDIFLMPSLYEPCGLNQMYSHAYGTAPVVRKVGGLADTVRHFDGTHGDGFVFEHFDEQGLGWALGQALDTHLDRRRFQVLQRNAMAVDHSWDARAPLYLDVYRRAVRRDQASRSASRAANAARTPPRSNSSE
jgi:starch synthase